MDAIVSVAGLVVGIAGATSARGPIFTAGLVAGAAAMAVGEYMSVSPGAAARPRARRAGHQLIVGHR